MYTWSLCCVHIQILLTTANFRTICNEKCVRGLCNEKYMAFPNTFGLDSPVIFSFSCHSPQFRAITSLLDITLEQYRTNFADTSLKHLRHRKPLVSSFISKLNNSEIAFVSHSSKNSFPEKHLKPMLSTPLYPRQ